MIGFPVIVNKLFFHRAALIYLDSSQADTATKRLFQFCSIRFLLRLWLGILSIAVLLLAGLTNPANAAKYKIRWYLGHANLDYFEQAAASFRALAAWMSM